VNPVDGDELRDALVLQDVQASVLDVASVTCDTVVVAATRRMKRSAARIIPASTATVRSATTVSTNVTAHTARSVHP
jgi:hypothetical protein